MGTVTTLYVPNSKEEVWKAFVELAKREKGDRGVSEMLLAVVEEYVKAHGEGNPSFSLDKFREDPQFAAYPTPWGRPLGYKELEPFSWKEEDEMIKRLEGSLSTLRLDRQKKRDQDIKAKGLRLKS